MCTGGEGRATGAWDSSFAPWYPKSAPFGTVIQLLRGSLQKYCPFHHLWVLHMTDPGMVLIWDVVSNNLCCTFLRYYQHNNSSQVLNSSARSEKGTPWLSCTATFSRPCCSLPVTLTRSLASSLPRLPSRPSTGSPITPIMKTQTLQCSWKP